MDAGTRYYDVNRTVFWHVILVEPEGRVLIEQYIPPCEVPQDLAGRLVFETHGAFHKARRSKELNLADNEAPLDHVFALLLNSPRDPG